MADRFLQLMRASMGRFPAVSREVNIQTLIDACDHYFKKNEAISYIVPTNAKGADAVDRSNAIYISDFAVTSADIAILLVRGDPRRGLPSFVNPKTRKVTVAAASDPEAVPGASSHIIISRQSIAAGKDQGRHRMVMERTRGVGRVLARDFMTGLMERYAQDFPDKFTAEKRRKNAKDKPETVAFRPTISFSPQPNGNLKTDLQEGRIGGFKLTRGRTKFEGEADEATVQRFDVQLSARIVPTDNFARVRATIEHARELFGSVDFEALNLELVDEGGQPIGHTKALKVDQLDEGEMRYCKTIAAGDLGDGVVDCYAEFFQPMLKVARVALNKSANWTT